MLQCHALLLLKLSELNFKILKIKFYLMQVHKKHSCSVLWEAEGRRVSPTTLTDTEQGWISRARLTCAPHLTLRPVPRLLLSTEFPSETIQ